MNKQETKRYYRNRDNRNNNKMQRRLYLFLKRATEFKKYVYMNLAIAKDFNRRHKAGIKYCIKGLVKFK